MLYRVVSISFPTAITTPGILHPQHLLRSKLSNPTLGTIVPTVKALLTHLIPPRLSPLDPTHITRRSNSTHISPTPLHQPPHLHILLPHQPPTRRMLPRPSESLTQLPRMTNHPLARRKRQTTRRRPRLRKLLVRESSRSGRPFRELRGRGGLQGSEVVEHGDGVFLLFSAVTVLEFRVEADYVYFVPAEVGW